MSIFSIIVPIYCGIQYMESILGQAEENRKRLGEEDQVGAFAAGDGFRPGQRDRFEYGC